MERLPLVTDELQKLSNIEFDVFFDNLVNHYDKRQFITKLLTHLIIDEVRNKNESKHSQTIHQYIQDTMNKRENDSKSQNINKHIKFNINSLSSTTISSLSTYLKFQEIMAFQLTNKYLYTSNVSTANSYSKIILNQNMIQKYFNNFGDYFINYKFNNLSRFRNITTLDINLQRFM